MIRKSTPGTIHVLAVCKGCSWTCDDYKAAEVNAQHHVLDTGHSVLVERAQSWTYSPSANEKRK